MIVAKRNILYQEDLYEECVAFKKWLSDAKPYDKIIYHRGYLSDLDRHILPLKELVWKQAVQGKVYLVQRKAEIYGYEYIAQKAKEQIPGLIPWDYFYDYRNRTRKGLATIRLNGK